MLVLFVGEKSVSLARLHIKRLLTCIFMSVVATTAFAQKASRLCQVRPTWSQATYLKRVAVDGSISSSAEWRRYQGVTWFSQTLDGKVMTMLQLSNGLKLVAGSSEMTPESFNGIEASVESPMWTQGIASFRKYSAPCLLPEGESVAVNERDLINADSLSSSTPKFFGNIKREALLDRIRITYSIEIQRARFGASDERFQSLYGSWEYQNQLDRFPADFDIQGWHVFKDGELLRQISVGSPFPISRLSSEADKR